MIFLLGQLLTHVSVWDKKLDLESILSVQVDMNFVSASKNIWNWAKILANISIKNAQGLINSDLSS